MATPPEVTSETDPMRYLDPRILNKIANLDLKARLVVEGFIAGMHKSPYRGFSVEFAEHREYVAGDDLKHLDWKVYAKSDRYYIKQYEEETNFRAHIVLDTSESMTYGSGEGAPSKLEYGKYMAASLAYMIQQQSDAVGLYPFHKDIYSEVPPSTHRNKLHEILRLLDKPTIGKDTAVGPILQQLAGRVGTRGIVIFISDLFDKPKDFQAGLSQLLAKNHEVIVFHLFDRYELTFPFDRMTRFDGLEQFDRLMIDPRPLRQAYLEEVEQFNAEIRRICLRNRADYRLVDTDTPLDVVLSKYLAVRAGGRRGG